MPARQEPEAVTPGWLGEGGLTSALKGGEGVARGSLASAVACCEAAVNPNGCIESSRDVALTMAHMPCQRYEQSATVVSALSQSHHFFSQPHQLGEGVTCAGQERSSCSAPGRTFGHVESPSSQALATEVITPLMVRSGAVPLVAWCNPCGAHLLICSPYG